MKLMIDFEPSSPDKKIHHTDSILLIGSCFTENIGAQFKELKFQLQQNPNGIIFDPISIARALVDYTRNKRINSTDLFFHNELWNSWHHHSRFSGLNKQSVLDRINDSYRRAHEFLQKADWVIITLGSAFQYRQIESNSGVANCHKVPANQFRKHLLGIDEINAALDNCIHQLFAFNKNLNIIFTVSPIRHLRDGIVENNRSKARLLEVVHNLANKFERIYYFPAYELVIDVLRDYRFYEADLVHPNAQATSFVFEHFMQLYIDDASIPLVNEVQKIRSAFHHQPFQAETEAYKRFMLQSKNKAEELQRLHPHLDFKEELLFFTRQLASS